MFRYSTVSRNTSHRFASYASTRLHILGDHVPLSFAEQSCGNCLDLQLFPCQNHPSFTLERNSAKGRQSVNKKYYFLTMS